MKDDMVIIKDDDNLPRNRWKKGVVNELIVGKDSEVRGAIIRVCGKKNKVHTLKRPIQRLIPLELLREDCEKNERYVVDNDSTVGKQEVTKSKSTRPRRSAAATGELIRRIMNDD